MQFNQPVGPITGDDDTIRAAVEHAAVGPLLASLAFVTGDLTLLRDDLKPDPTLMLGPEGGLTPDQIARGQELAADTLLAFRDAGSPLADLPDSDALHQIMEFLVGGPVMPGYEPLFREELALGGEDLRAPTWKLDDVSPGSDFRVLVIGTGMSGIVAALRLQQARIPFVVIDKNADVGGTWFENTYPGCRVDVSNHFYSYSFAQRDDWPQYFSTQSELLDYFRRCVEAFGLRDHMRFETTVESMTWDDDALTWTVELSTPSGPETIAANAVISGVGQLNRPNLPDIAGRDRFTGPSFHSAEWDPQVDLIGKRVAVIGTGASAAQLIPIVAEQAAELKVFQRTANWLIPTPDYHDEVSEETQWVFRSVPSYAQWYRLWLFWRNAEGMLPMAMVDPDWADKTESVSMMNEMLRQLLLMYLNEEFADRPDLLEKVTPHYPPAAKRVIRDNGIWARTLKRDNVELIVDKITEITETGIATGDGEVHEVDVIIYGTGFTASKFLMPMKVTGRDGRDLHATWDGDARAYLGVTVPHFPNLFLLYGPNTNIVINGSIIFFSECEVHYAIEALRMALEHGKRALDCKVDVHDEYNERIDEANRGMAWGASTVNSWYKNDKGRVAQNWPFSLLAYWEQTRTPNPNDYELL